MAAAALWRGYGHRMLELQPLRAEHGAAVLRFEQDNRTYFGSFVSDRGDEYFDHFQRYLDDALTEQAAVLSAFYVLLDEGASVIGRFNLFDLHDGTGRLGYRVAEAASGRGVATATVKEMCALAADVFGLRVLEAAVSGANVASRKVLLRNRFVPTRPAAPSDLGGRSGSWFERDLTSH